MRKLLGRALGTAQAAVSALMVVGCTATVAGAPVKATDRADADGAVVALLDTGSYPTAAGSPFGTAGRVNGALMEAHRMGVDVVGPWQADPTFRQRGPVVDTTITGPFPEARLLAQNRVLPDPIADVAAAHGFITGFSSMRTAGPTKALLNVALRFPDVDAAGAAAREMSDKYAYEDVHPTPITIERHPEAIATLDDIAGGGVIVSSFTARGASVLFQAVHIDDRTETAAAPRLIALVLDKQEPLIDRFKPTEPAKLADLPKDFTGHLLARTLWAPDNSGPFIVGVWEPTAWLHFEDDPIKAADLFRSAGVEAVAQRMTTVYQTRDTAGAGQVVEQLAADMRASDGIHPITGITGLPGAQCFARTKTLNEPNPPPSWQRVVWPFKCVARADRYAFTAFSADEKDVKQQMAAQYRILAGK
jgi:hypothetical protein